METGLTPYPSDKDRYFLLNFDAFLVISCKQKKACLLIAICLVLLFSKALGFKFVQSPPSLLSMSILCSYCFVCVCFSGPCGRSSYRERSERRDLGSTTELSFGSVMDDVTREDL